MHDESLMLIFHALKTCIKVDFLFLSIQSFLVERSKMCTFAPRISQVRAHTCVWEYKRRKAPAPTDVMFRLKRKKYFKLRYVSYDAVNNQVAYNGCFYVSQTARNEGALEIPELYLDGFVKTDVKDGNLFEIAYNNIKEIAETYRGKTLDSVQEEINEMHANGEIVDLLVHNPIYTYFVDAEDC